MSGVATCRSCPAPAQVTLTATPVLLCAHHYAQDADRLAVDGFVVSADARAALTPEFCSGWTDPGVRVEREQLPDGCVRHCRYNKARRLADGPDGQPAFQVVTRTGTVVRVERFDDGVRCDGPHGEPAEVWLHANGRPASIRHRARGLLHDPPTGEAAVRWFDESGQCVQSTSYVDGRPSPKAVP